MFKFVKSLRRNDGYSKCTASSGFIIFYGWFMKLSWWIKFMEISNIERKVFWKLNLPVLSKFPDRLWKNNCLNYFYCHVRRNIIFFSNSNLESREKPQRSSLALWDTISMYKNIYRSSINENNRKGYGSGSHRDKGCLAVHKCSQRVVPFENHKAEIHKITASLKRRPQTLAA